TTTVRSIDELHALSGRHLGWSEWHVMEQQQVNLFADATGDHQWIHVDPERAKAGPFGVAIAHGYLTLSLIPSLLQSVVTIEGMTFGVNYGANKIRFPAPVPVGTEIRLGVSVTSVEDIADGVAVLMEMIIEVRDAPKPSLVAEIVYRYYR
ncbi:MAG TPA: MaoC family dehydratase, partial [Acidimicrobiales bacterium]|nr:MaoC family dehydratase [Acidimicrobiales bacterium]